MIGILWNLLFRKLLGPLDGVKTKLGTIVVLLSAVMNAALTAFPALATLPAYQALMVWALKIGGVLAGLGVIDGQAKLKDALAGKG